MEQWLRDEIAREEGYTICPLSYETYTYCDNNCKKCELYIDFIKALKDAKGVRKNGKTNNM